MIFKGRYDFLHTSNLLPNILYEPSSDAYFDSFLNEEMGILISVYLVKIKTVFEHYIIYFSKYSFEGAVLNIRQLLLTVFLDSYISKTRNVEWA